MQRCASRASCHFAQAAVVCGAAGLLAPQRSAGPQRRNLRSNNCVIVFTYCRLLLPATHGQGPSREDMLGGFFKMKVLAWAAAEEATSKNSGNGSRKAGEPLVVQVRRLLLLRLGCGLTWLRVYSPALRLWLGSTRAYKLQHAPRALPTQPYDTLAVHPNPCCHAWYRRRWAMRTAMQATGAPPAWPWRQRCAWRCSRSSWTRAGRCSRAAC